MPEPEVVADDWGRRYDMDPGGWAEYVPEAGRTRLFTEAGECLGWMDGNPRDDLAGDDEDQADDAELPALEPEPDRRSEHQPRRRVFGRHAKLPGRARPARMPAYPYGHG